MIYGELVNELIFKSNTNIAATGDFFCTICNFALAINKQSNHNMLRKQYVEVCSCKLLYL